MKKGGYKELKILSSLHTWVITNLPSCSNALLTSSPDLCMEVFFKLQTSLRCVPLKRENSSGINWARATWQEAKLGEKKQIKCSFTGFIKNRVIPA